MTRYILFNGAPSVAHCTASQRGQVGPSRWESTSIEFASPSSTPSRSFNILDGAAPATVTTTEHNRDTSSTSPSRFRDAPDPEMVVQAPRNGNKRRKTSHEGLAALALLPEGESLCQSFFMFPPPSQPRTNPRAGPRSSGDRGNVGELMDVAAAATMAPLDEEGRRGPPADDTTFLRHDLTSIMMTSEHGSDSPRFNAASSSPVLSDDDQAGTSSLELSIGAPPALPWAIHDLTKLDRLRTRLGLSRPPVREPVPQHGGVVVVSVLGVVVSVDVKETSSNRNARVAEVVLGDETGASVKLVAWGIEGGELNEALRTGDVVYFGRVKLLRSKYDGALELRLIERTSRVGIAYRTRVFDEDEDGVYRFDREWARELEQARAVFDIVDWWTTHRE